MSDPNRNPAFQRRWSEPSPVYALTKTVESLADNALGQLGLALLEAWRKQQASDRGPPR